MDASGSSWARACRSYVGDRFDGPHDKSELLCVLERDAPADAPIPTEEAAERFAAVITALRLWTPGGVILGRPAGARLIRRAGSRSRSVPALRRARPVGFRRGRRAGLPRVLRGHRRLKAARRGGAGRSTASRWAASAPWRPRRYPTTCSRCGRSWTPRRRRAEASLALRLAALCAEEGARRGVQQRLEAALALERFVMGGATAGPAPRRGVPAELVMRPRSTCAPCCATCSAATSTPT